MNAACTAGKGPDSDTVVSPGMSGGFDERFICSACWATPTADASGSTMETLVPVMLRIRSASESTMASAAGVGTTNVDFIALLASICPWGVSVATEISESRIAETSGTKIF